MSLLRHVAWSGLKFGQHLPRVNRRRVKKCRKVYKKMSNLLKCINMFGITMKSAFK